MVKGFPVPRLFYGYTVVAVAFLTQFVMKLVHLSFGVFLVPVADELGWSRGLISGAYSLNMIVFGFVGVAAGRLVDRIGPRLLLSGGAALVGLGYIWAGVMQSPWEFYVAFGVLVGIGLSTTYVPLSTTIARWFTSRRGTMMGILVAGSGFGGLVGPLLTERLIPQFGWRFTSAALGALAFIICFALAQWLIQDPNKVGLEPYVGRASSEGRALPSGYSSMTVRESVTTAPFWTLCTAWAAHGFFGAGMVVHIYAYATDSGVASDQAALLLGLLGGAGLTGSLLIGSLVQAAGLRVATVIAFTFTTVGLTGVLVSSSIEFLFLSVFIFGLGWLAIGALVPSIVADQFGLGRMGSLMGVVECAWAIGAAIGPITLGIIFDLTGTYSLGFLIAIVASSVCIILTPSFTRSRSGVLPVG